MDVQQIVILVIGVVVLGAFMFWPQYRARRRREKQMAELSVGDEIMTVGGIIGKLTYLGAEENHARIEVAPGVEIRVVLAAISAQTPYDVPHVAKNSEGGGSGFSKKPFLSSRSMGSDGD